MITQHGRKIHPVKPPLSQPERLKTTADFPSPGNAANTFLTAEKQIKTQTDHITTVILMRKNKVRKNADCPAARRTIVTKNVYFGMTASEIVNAALVGPVLPQRMPTAAKRTH